MKLISKKVIIAVFAFFLLTGILIGGQKILVFWDKSPAQIRVLKYQDELYISVSDLSKYFAGSILYDLSHNRLDFFSLKAEKAAQEKAGETDSLSPSPPQTASLWGKAFIREKDLEIPLRGLPIILRKTRTDLSEAMIQGLFSDIVINGEGSYEELFPQVRSQTTDESGVFVIKDIPPGTYELVARYQGKKEVLGWRWLVKLKKGETLEFVLSGQTAVVRTNVRK